MNRTLYAASTLCVALLASGVSGAEVKLDGSHTKVEFTVSHMVVSTVTGRFKSLEGKADFDAKSGAVSNVRVVVKVDSVDTANEKRDGHLKSADFFDAAGSPEIVFVSTKTVHVRKGKTAILPGTITIRGVTKPLNLKFTYAGSVKSPFGPIVHAFRAEGSVDRQAFGVKWNKPMEAGGLLVGNEVRLSITGEAQ